MQQLEYLDQQALFAWWANWHRTRGLADVQLFAIPNGGLRSLRTAARLKKEGVKAGVPDVFLAVPTARHGGLFIEMKRDASHGSKGRLSEAQKVALLVFEQAGYATCVAYGWKAAVAAIERYLEEAETIGPTTAV